MTQHSYEEQNDDCDEQQQPVFESLDVVLDKARKRPMIMLIPYQIQAVMNKPIIKLSLPIVSNSSDSAVPPSIITLGDIILVLAAVKLNSVGFAFGYVLGKLSTQLLRETKVLPIALVELWTVILAVGLDVVWNNFAD